MSDQKHIEPRKEIELFTRKELARKFKIGISSLDLIPENELPRVRFGKSVRFTINAIHTYIQNHENKTSLSSF
jgi:hypothetical protein